ncbi:MAG: SigB/SigF/SigG family RNA polymerase sigma factor [Bacillota bacterium]|nr:SigB/SigF/SigG family RNA polymerase sigma factor [Bacillota bacterium]
MAPAEAARPAGGGSGGPGAEAEREELFRRLRQGDRSARDRLVELNLPLVRSLIERLPASREEREDLLQVGVVGLLKAIDGFDPERGTRFSTYAVPTILGELRGYLRSSAALHVSRDLQELARKARSLEAELAQAEGRSPGVEELARRLGVERDRLVEALAAREAVRSLDAPLENDEPGGSTLAALVGGDSPESDWLDSLELRQALARLDPRERLLLHLRFFREMTQQQVAERLGLSQVHVSRLERRALRHLREMLGTS